MDPDQPVPSRGDSAFLADAPAAAIDALLWLAGPGADTPLASVEVRHRPTCGMRLYCGLAGSAACVGRPAGRPSLRPMRV